MRPHFDQPAFDLEAGILAAPIEVREWLARHFTPSALRRARLAERDGLLIRLAAGRDGDAENIAKEIHGLLLRYHVGAWRYDQERLAPGLARHAAAHRILTLDQGHVLSARSLRRLLAPVAKKTPGDGHGSQQSSTVKETPIRERDYEIQIRRRRQG